MFRKPRLPELTLRGRPVAVTAAVFTVAIGVSLLSVISPALEDDLRDVDATLAVLAKSLAGEVSLAISPNVAMAGTAETAKL